MSRKTARLSEGRQAALRALACAALALLGWFIYETAGIEAREYAWMAAVYKYVMLAAGLGLLALLATGELKRLRNLPSLLLLAYAAYSLISVLWSASGRIFIQRYSSVFVAACCFAFAVLRGRGDAKFARNAMAVCAGVSAIYAVASVEAASTGLFLRLAQAITPIEDWSGVAFVQRLNGVFTDANIEASFYALGILFSAALLAGANRKGERALWAAALACDACAMVLGVSVGAIACLAVAVVVYLFAAGEMRGALLTRLIFGTVCGGGAALAAYRLHDRSQALMLAAMLAGAVAAVVLELLLGARVSGALQPYAKTVLIAALALAGVAAAYLLVGMRVSKPLTFGADTELVRTVELAPGEHTLALETDAAPEDVLVYVYSQTEEEVLVYKRTTLFYEQATSATFTVPDDSVTCAVYLKAAEGKTISAATIDGTRKLPLRFAILPEFVARRLTNPFSSTSLRQRMTYVRDGFKLFRLRPAGGFGCGAFNSLSSLVQDYEYESVHTHNQYVEALLEGGAIGFALFTGAALAVGVTLWKACKKERAGAYAWIYPALVAEFVMSALQMLWDVTMYVTVFTCMVYTLWGLIAGAYAEPLTLKSEAAETPKQKKKAAKRDDAPIRLACCALPLIFLVTLSLNVYAQRLIRQKAGTIERFMGYLERGAKLDLYERDDITLSYVRAQMEYDTEGVYRAQADVYAEELSSVMSNTIPYMLSVYYLNSQQYELGIAEAKQAAVWSASSSNVWNQCADALRQMFIDSGAYSPLLGAGGDVLLRELSEYRQMLVERDERSVKPIKLDEGAAAFFNAVERLEACGGDMEAVRAVLTGTAEG